MRGARQVALIALAAMVTAAGCATYDSAVPAGTGIGAAGGALIGYGMTGSGLGAAAGAGAGALAGALTGLAVDESRRASPPPQPLQSYQTPPPPYGTSQQAYGPLPDPTKGRFINRTPWRIEIYVDGATSPLLLGPMHVARFGLDVGTHRVLAKAYVSTQFGERLLGSYDRKIYIDPRGVGWSLRFNDRMF